MVGVALGGKELGGVVGLLDAVGGTAVSVGSVGAVKVADTSGEAGTTWLGWGAGGVQALSSRTIKIVNHTFCFTGFSPCLLSKYGMPHIIVV